MGGGVGLLYMKEYACHPVTDYWWQLSFMQHYSKLKQSRLFFRINIYICIRKFNKEYDREQAFPMIKNRDPLMAFSVTYVHIGVSSSRQGQWRGVKLTLIRLLNCCDTNQAALSPCTSSPLPLNFIPPPLPFCYGQLEEREGEGPRFNRFISYNFFEKKQDQKTWRRCDPKLLM